MKKVLIVDDEENARLYLSAILLELYPEFEILMAASPAHALAHIKSDCPQLLLLDVEMPGMSGLDMLRELRECISTSELAVVFVSGYKRAEFIQHAMRLNAIDYIDKPVDPYDLKRAVDKIIAQQSLQAPVEQRICVLTALGDLHFYAHEVLYFQSEGRYARLFFTESIKPVLVRINLTALMQVLPVDHFVRVSRQCIVNKKHIKIVSQCNLSITLFNKLDKIVIYRVYPSFYKK